MNLSFNSLILLIVSTFTFSIFASDTPYELRGAINFDDMTNAIFSKRYEPVYAFTQQGRKRLLELRSLGWSCSIKPRQTYLCSKANVASEVPGFINEKARLLFNSISLIFEDRVVSPVLLSDAESLTVYRFNKEVSLNGVVYPFFDYSISHSSNGDIHKVKWGEGLKRQEFVVNGVNDLKKVSLFSDQEKKYYDLFVIEGRFR